MKSISGKELCRVLERRGWVLRRVRGSHHIFTKPDVAAILTVPVHGNRDLKIGLLKRLMKDAELNEDDL